MENPLPANPPSTGGGTAKITPTPKPIPQPPANVPQHKNTDNPRANLGTAVPSAPTLTATVDRITVQNNVLTISCSYVANWNFPLANLEVQGNLGCENFTIANVTYTTFDVIINSNSYQNALQNNGSTLAVSTTGWLEWQCITSTKAFSGLVTAPEGTIVFSAKAGGPVNINAYATTPPTNYEASKATSMESYNGEIDFTFQGCSADKTVALTGGNLGRVYNCSPYGTNEFYCYVSVPNANEAYAIYYLVQINGGPSTLDPNNTNTGSYNGVECSYYLYEPKN